MSYNCRMAIDIGTRFGPYEIVAALGAGGMGEVYRANDTRLDRTVAIKILPIHLSGDPALRQRFEREARTISRLSHPNICALYDIGHQDGVEFLVMEYLEGETLAERLKRGALPKDQVLRYGMEIAEALDAAHRQGVVHRDLKPGNVMLTKSGAKLLDFGLAKLRTSELLSPLTDFSFLPTEAGQNLTAEGTILGTFYYMAPEQLEGKDTDARSDIFSLGTVLYEMATGQRPFGGQSQASIISAILSSDPASICVIQPALPPALDHIIKKALAKNPEDRWQTARDLASELRWIAEGGSQAAVTAPLAPWRWKRNESLFRLLSAIFFVTTIAMVFAFYRFAQTPKQLQPVKLSVLPPPKTMATDSLAISRDGRKLALVTTGAEGHKSLWVRSFDSLTVEPLPQTDDAAFPFWSPDNRFIAFFTQNKLKKMEISGGPPQVLCDVSNARGGAWNQEGLMLIAPTFTSGLSRLSATGGALTPLTTLDSSRQETSHRWPWFLPNGRHFLYVILGAERKNCGIFLSSIDDPKQKQQLLPDFSRVEYVAPGYLIFTRGTTLMAHEFDADHLQLKGEAFSLRENVGYDGYTAYGIFSVSQKDVLTFGSIDQLKTQLIWTDRSGRRISSLGELARYAEPRLSPDEKKLVVERIDPATANFDLWIVELSRGTFTRFTFDPSNEVSPIWSPDGKRIVFCSNPRGSVNIYQKSSSGTGEDEILVDTPNPKYPTDWSRDGKYILYDEIDPKSKFDLWILPLSADRKPMPFLHSQFNESHGQFSPDGKWIAYTSDETGRAEIYVRSFPAAGEKWQISTNGGDQAQWRRDGKELYYMAGDNKLMMVQVRTLQTFETEVPIPLFNAQVPPNTMTDARNQYVMSADAQRFLVTALASESTASPITVVLNWRALLRE